MYVVVLILPTYRHVSGFRFLPRMFKEINNDYSAGMSNVDATTWRLGTGEATRSDGWLQLYWRAVETSV